MFVSVFAGGTASTEFEALTSNSMAYIPNGITAYTTYINSPMTSLASTLKAQGYGGIIAMHPYKGTGYKRNKVYPLLGFNKFLTMDDFAKDTETYGLHIYPSADFSSFHPYCIPSTEFSHSVSSDMTDQFFYGNEFLSESLSSSGCRISYSFHSSMPLQLLCNTISHNSLSYSHTITPFLENLQSGRIHHPQYKIRHNPGNLKPGLYNLCFPGQLPLPPIH